VKVNVVSGFLGSGKTTFVLQAVATLNKAPGEKIAILVNEFGKIGVDGEIVGREAVDVMELASGCICCSLKTSLKQAILDIADRFAPDRLIIEPSGIALPSQIVETIEMPQVAAKAEVESLIHLIDAFNFFKCAAGLGDFYLKAISTAHVVVINKVDLVSAHERESVAKVVADFNPEAAIFHASFAEIPLAEVFRSQPQKIAQVHEHVPNLSFNSYAAELTGQHGEAEIKRFFEQLDSGIFGEVLRAKGIFQTERGRLVQVDYVMGRTDFQEVGEGRCRISIIGRNLDEPKLAKHISGFIK